MHWHAKKVHLFVIAILKNAKSIKITRASDSTARNDDGSSCNWLLPSTTIRSFLNDKKIKVVFLSFCVWIIITDVIDISRRFAARHKRIADRHVIATKPKRFINNLKIKFWNCTDLTTDEQRASDDDRCAQRRLAFAYRTSFCIWKKNNKHYFSFMK